jgi:hypothetical protein
MFLGLPVHFFFGELPMKPQDFPVSSSPISLPTESSEASQILQKLWLEAQQPKVPPAPAVNEPPVEDALPARAPYSLD